MAKSDEEAKQALIRLDKEEVIFWVKERLNRGQPPIEILNVLAQGLEVIGDLYSRGELYIPELVFSGEIFKAASDKLKPSITKEQGRGKSKGSIVIGTVKGDLHDLGKNLVAMMMRNSGFEVIDVGKDVPVERFVEAVSQYKPNILGLSALLTTTMKMQAEIIEALKNEGLKDNVKVIIGGAPVDQDWANQIGADAYGSDAVDAVRIVERLINRIKAPSSADANLKGSPDQL